jgi:hypothetical protein
MRRGDARGPTDRDPELLVPISGRRIWHMSDDRQAGVLWVPPFSGLICTPQLVSPSPRAPHPPLTDHREEINHRISRMNDHDDDEEEVRRHL